MKTTLVILSVSFGVACGQTQYAFTNLATGLEYPIGPTVDAFGQVYLATGFNTSKISRISPDGQVVTFAPTLAFPVAVAVDDSTNIFVGDIERRAILKISSDGSLSTFAGSTTGLGGAVDGIGTAARFTQPEGIAHDPSGNLWVVDGRTRIRRVTPDGVVTTIVSRTHPIPWDGYATNAAFVSASGITVDAQTNVFVVDRNCIRRIVPVGTNWFVSTIAGLYSQTGSADGIGTAARFNRPHGITLDGNGNLYVGDEFNHVIRKLTPIGTNWMVRTIAGSPGQTGNSTGLGESVRFSYPMTLAANSTGLLYIADNGNARVVSGFSSDLPVDLEFLPGLGRPRFSEGNLEVLLAGPTNMNVVIEVTTDFNNWSPVQTNMIPATGLLELAIEQSAEATERFYRARRSE